MPPISCTSKARRPSARRAASRQLAKASGSSASRLSPPRARSEQLGRLRLDPLVAQRLELRLERVDLLDHRHDRLDLAVVSASFRSIFYLALSQHIQAAYDEGYATQEPGTEYSAAHILVATEAEAQAVVEELAGGADFATIARERDRRTRDRARMAATSAGSAKA
jgi:hypothetical protein